MAFVGRNWPATTQIIATGAGAALALDFIGYVRSNKLMPVRGVTICYSSASLALLQFVTNNLLAERIPGIHVKTALTRHDDLEARYYHARAHIISTNTT